MATQYGICLLKHGRQHPLGWQQPVNQKFHDQKPSLKQPSHRPSIKLKILNVSYCTCMETERVQLILVPNVILDL